MSKAILRVAKLKGGSLGAAVSHLERSRATPNADPERADTNLVLRGGDQPMQAIQDRLASAVMKRRSNSVEAVELFIGTSPDWDGWDDQSRTGELNEQAHAWVDQSLAWADDTFGADNVVVAQLHRDELTPHLSVFVTPIDAKGSLNARQWTAGRQAMAAMQTSYHDAVADLGLERGVKGSRARHESVQRWYGVMESGAVPPVPVVAVEPKSLLQNPKAHAADESERNNDEQADAIGALTVQARAGMLAQQRVQDLQRTLIEQQEAAQAERAKLITEANQRLREMQRIIVQRDHTIAALQQEVGAQAIELADLRGMDMNRMLAVLREHYPPKGQSELSRQQAAVRVTYDRSHQRQAAYLPGQDGEHPQRLMLTDKEAVRNTFDLAKWWIRDDQGRQLAAKDVQARLCTHLSKDDFRECAVNDLVRGAAADRQPDPQHNPAGYAVHLHRVAVQQRQAQAADRWQEQHDQREALHREQQAKRRQQAAAAPRRSRGMSR